jgi:hypothetical protein
MEVRLRRQPSGCIYWPLTFVTFGVFAWLKSLGERHFIQQMNEAGVLTRGGTHVRWNEFTSLERWQVKMSRSAFVEALSDEYILKSRRGRVSLPLWRTENAKEALDYLVKHLPPNVLPGDH